MSMCAINPDRVRETLCQMQLLEITAPLNTRLCAAAEISTCRFSLVGAFCRATWGRSTLCVSVQRFCLSYPDVVEVVNVGTRVESQYLLKYFR